ncbi:hypothetical protein CYMTET_16853 [Cymbomonas tetramitiformis]|uniref:Uncharacterized protein n=1 Tax=Cymbomonas tetramitiformis TaxID=36881 RepID=A0AAE0GBD2_9CHLO|nr:hypothetical protein CYMTET_16853 [Cymbomonas tetramitiformis]
MAHRSGRELWQLVRGEPTAEGEGPASTDSPGMHLILSVIGGCADFTDAPLRPAPALIMERDNEAGVDAFTCCTAPVRAVEALIRIASHPDGIARLLSEGGLQAVLEALELSLVVAPKGCFEFQVKSCRMLQLVAYNTKAMCFLLDIPLSSTPRKGSTPLKSLSMLEQRRRSFGATEAALKNGRVAKVLLAILGSRAEDHEVPVSAADTLAALCLKDASSTVQQQVLQGGGVELLSNLLQHYLEDAAVCCALLSAFLAVAYNNAQATKAIQEKDVVVHVRAAVTRHPSMQLEKPIHESKEWKMFCVDHATDARSVDHDSDLIVLSDATYIPLSSRYLNQNDGVSGEKVGKGTGRLSEEPNPRSKEKRKKSRKWFSKILTKLSLN